VGGVCGGVGEGDLKARLVLDGQAGHLDAVCEAGCGAQRLEGLKAYWSEKHPIQVERLAGRASDGKMAEVGRVETASEEGDAHELS
jgi:hypothetical protein